MSLKVASQLLGVSPERVRQLVAAGDLPGVRFGNAWAVPRDAVSARRHVSNRRGRPLGAKRAWAAIIAGQVDLSNSSRFRNRGEAHRYSMSAADADHLVGDVGAALSGVDAAVHFGEQLSPGSGEVSLYVSAQMHSALDSLVVAVSDPLGSVVLRVVGDDLWPVVVEASLGRNASPLVVPRAAAALDLMESGDPRHWVAAENLVRNRV